MLGRLFGLLLLLAVVYAHPAALEDVEELDNKNHDIETQTFNVIENGTVCMTISLAAVFSVPYTVEVNGSAEERWAKLLLPSANSSSLDGSNCPDQDGLDGRLQVNFGSTLGQSFSMNISVEGNGSKATWAVRDFQLTVDFEDSEYFNNSEQTNKAEFTSTDVGLPENNANGYTCARNQTVIFLGDSANVTMTYRDVQINPFNSSSFTNCEKTDKVNRIVPIAVGAALAFLLLLVLVAYIINRASSKRRGYEKV